MRRTKLSHLRAAISDLARTEGRDDPMARRRAALFATLTHILAKFAGLWDGVPTDDPTLDRPSLPGYAGPTERQFLTFVRSELAAVGQLERVGFPFDPYHQLILWGEFLRLLGAPVPDPPRREPDVWGPLQAHALLRCAPCGRDRADD